MDPPTRATAPRTPGSTGWWSSTISERMGLLQRDAETVWLNLPPIE
ncbi:MAG: hypothetical protein ACKO4A_09890 [Gammaproteobacteria bacterium]